MIYMLLQRTFKLPSVKTLSRNTQNIQDFPSFNINVPEAIKQKGFSMECKLCAVARDEIMFVKHIKLNLGLITGGARFSPSLFIEELT